MSEDSGAAPPPYVLDVSVLTAITRGDYDVMSYIQALASQGRPLVIPVLAVTAAVLDMRTGDTKAILRGLERLATAIPAPLQGAIQAAALADVIAKTGLEPYDAHVAAVALASICSILTLDVPKWRQHERDLDEPLYIVEIADPEEGDS